MADYDFQIFSKKDLSNIFHFLIFINSSPSKVLKTYRLPIGSPVSNCQSLCSERKTQNLYPSFSNTTSLQTNKIYYLILGNKKTNQQGIPLDHYSFYWLKLWTSHLFTILSYQNLNIQACFSTSRFRVGLS